MNGPYSVRTKAYFDCNATTPTLDVAADAALLAMRTLYGNPSSTHLVGIQAKAILDSARRAVAKAVGCSTGNITFTSGATEAIQTAVFSALTAKSSKSNQSEAGRVRVLYGATEHKAVPQALHHWAKVLSVDADIISLPVDATGRIVLGALERELPGASLLCTMAVNNETGAIQDLGAIERLLELTGSRALWLVDGVQALGKVPVNLKASRIDYACFSGHKLYATKGVGVLYVADGAPFTPLLVGGGQERGMRSGTENLPGLAALGTVLELFERPGGDGPVRTREELLGFRDQLVTALRDAFPKVEFNTPFEQAVPTTINFAVPGFSSKEMIDLFDSGGLRLSAGSACNSGQVTPSHVLEAMGMPEWRCASALRLSFGPCTTRAEIDLGCQTIRECAIALRASCLLDAPGGFELPERLRDGVIHLRAGASNTWVIAHRQGKSCVIVDPCNALAERLEHFVRCQGLDVAAIVDTHSHADHESLRPALQLILADRMRPSSGFDPLGWPHEVAAWVTLDDGTSAPYLRLGDAPDGGALVLARIATPGHTDDSHALLFAVARDGRVRAEDVRFAFCGDTILSGGLGRTNFSMSDPAALFQSLKRMRAVVHALTPLCPAHDYVNGFATSFEAEHRSNRLLGLALREPETRVSDLDVFVREKRAIDGELEQLEREFKGIVCGVSSMSDGAGRAAPQEVVDLSLEQLRAFRSRGAPPILIDVREPHEFALYSDWSSLGLREPARNVPLSRFANFMGELAQDALRGGPEERERDVVLVCRSGNRSHQAARSLRRLGLARAWNLAGGIALVR
jgi:cysteine sulfinate desulfinase/cysteine desulfurase-like protein/glyoxylase-like metal-dependent hydrolase (beta-lactamase superfamily II)/rhodanese-related sulfurtransferase